MMSLFGKTIPHNNTTRFCPKSRFEFEVKVGRNLKVTGYISSDHLHLWMD